MKKTFKALKFSAVFLFTLTSFVACDKDFTELDSAVLGKDNANFNTDLYEVPIVSYNKKLESVQINNLSSYLLGVYKDPAYGLTSASIVTQVTPSAYAPSFGENPVIKSVVLTIPYYSRINNYDDEGNAEYTIQDSLYGDYTGTVKPFKLSIYKNDYFLRDKDLDGITTQNYYSYSNGTSDNMAYNGSSPINFDALKSTLIFQDENVIPSADAILTVTDKDTDNELTTRSVPAYKATLDNTFWENLIIKKEGQVELSNANHFKNYFRGLFFKAEAIGDDGNMVLLNMASTAANITITYSYDSTIIKGETIEATYTLNFTGNTLNTFVNNITDVTLENGDETNGDETLYLKGAGNSMAIVNLFKNDEAKKNFFDEFRIAEGTDYKKDKDGKYILKRLVNDAQLVIYEDDFMQTFPEDANGNDYSHFDRIYAYDIDNNTITPDYAFDQTDTTTPFNSKIISLGQRNVDEKGNYNYKIRLTEYLKNILVNNTTNTKIGLVLSTNVNYTTNAAIPNSDNADVTSIPAASIITPKGTKLYGSNKDDNNKKMRFKVFYTEPNN